MKEKKKLRLYFTDFWLSWNTEDNFFTELLSQRYDVIIDPVDPELLIYSNHSYNFIKYKTAVRLLFLGENVRPDFDECDFSLSFDYEDYDNKNLRFPLYNLYYGTEALLKPKNIEAIIQEKTHFCNMVVSNKKAKKRIEFFTILNSLKHVDSGGGVLNNIGGKIKDKLEFIKAYRFTIAFENAAYPGYTTEKIFEPMKVGSIPIYWGNKFIGRDFNSKSFINIHDFGTLKEAAEYIVDIDNSIDKYKAMLSEPWFTNNIPNQYCNPETLLYFIENTVMAIYPFTQKQIALRNKKATKSVLYKIIKMKLTGKAYCTIS